MKQVTLQFPSLQHLWDFKSKANAYNITVIAGKATLVAMLSEKAIEVALSNFGAKWLD